MKSFDDFDLKLGDIMRAERATLGKSLLDVQCILKIKASYIAAIERSDPSVFDVPAFIPGYVCSYARFLGLDPEWVLEKFCEEGNHSIERRLGPMVSGMPSRKPELARLVVRGEDRYRWPNTPFIPKSEGFLSKIDLSAVFSSVLLGAFIIAIGYGGWAVLRELQRVQLVQTDPVAALPLAPLAPSVPSGDGRPEPEELDWLYQPDPLALERPNVKPRDIAIGLLDSERGATVDEDREPASGSPDSASVEALEETPSESPVRVVEENVETRPREVVLLAVRPSWVRIRTPDGSVLLEKILDGGERYVVPSAGQMRILRTGNAGSVYFLVDGEAYGPLGEGPTVVDDIVMLPGEIMASYAVADPVSDSQLAEFVAMAEAPEGSP